MINKINLNLNKEYNFFCFSVNDMNFFIEKKNTLGFFNLKHKLNFNFFFKEVEKLDIDNLFYLFKYKA
jgi:adenine specific DNA methylase Mod